MPSTSSQAFFLLNGWFTFFPLHSIPLVRPYFFWNSQSYWHPSSVSCTTPQILSFQQWLDKMGHCFTFLQICGPDMFWRTGLDNMDLQWQTFLAGWPFVSFLDCLAFSQFLWMLRTLFLDRPCSSWNLRQTFHGTLGKLRDQNEGRAGITEYKRVTLDFVHQVHNFSIAALHLEW